MTIFLLLVSIGLETGCNFTSSKTSKNTQNSSTCNSTCSVSETDSSCSSEFDSQMSKVCQQACGVSDYDEKDIVDAVDAMVGDITKCPISGAIFKVKANSPDLKYNGKIFHSCCATCAVKFKDNPEKFVKNL